MEHEEARHVVKLLRAVYGPRYEFGVEYDSQERSYRVLVYDQPDTWSLPDLANVAYWMTVYAIQRGAA